MKRLFIVCVAATVMFTSGITGSRAEEDDTGGPSFMVLPIAFYTSDTGFGGGCAGLKSYYPERERTSNIQTMFIYTAKKQVSSAVKVDHYMKNGTDRILFGASYQKYPSDYFGIGNNTDNDDPGTYTPESFESKLGYERRMIGSLRVKANMSIRNQALVDENPRGALFLSGAPWPEGRLDIGAGFAVMWDSRDNLFATTTGTLAQLEYLGSLYQNEGRAYNTITLDVRHFFNPISGIVSASMFTLKDARGDVPFYELAMLGGQDRLRGYEYDRFRDRSHVLVQQDIRFHIWGPLGGAVFGAAGRVAESVDGLASGTYHTAFGGGLRYFFNREEKMALRGDYAIGRDSQGIYLTFSEAF